VIPTLEPTPASSKVAVAPGPATRVTPLGTPEAAVLLKPLRTVLVVPSKDRLPFGKSSMRWVSEAPSVRTNRVEKSVGAA
jgi:hypothetical protein